MIPVEEARSHILRACPGLGARSLRLQDALGCVAAEVVVAGEDVPPFANTAMDGYAVRAADTENAPVRLHVVATLAAGSTPDTEVGPGQAVRIMTGAPMPLGADAVVMVERTRPVDDGAGVVIEATAGPGDHVRGPGEDLRRGQALFESGTVLTPAHLGVLASVGRDLVSVVPPARVGVLSTGDELVAGGGPLRPGQIRDSNRPTLLALTAQAGCRPVDLGLVGDDEAALAEAVTRGVDTCDALVTSGGVSVGDFDYVKAVLDRLGDMKWWQVAVRPAKPLAFGLIGSTPVFGLPGNPVSSTVSFELFARPALRQMMGHTVVDRPRVTAIADQPMARQRDGKLHLVRVVADHGDDGVWHVRSSGGQGSHVLSAMARANALALLPDGDGAAAGAAVEVMLL
ncbi:MAG TPA: gephyrin-like molybdotransferase Glp [Acidimicrobiales bacterium]|nr:gephyrin-like molybdotransferase Glp [Acidimicrobiales bacterium]